MPPLDVHSLCRAVDRGERFTYRCFWGHRAPVGGGLSESCFSQWWPCRFVVDGQAYSSAEQFMMAGKARLFGDAEAAEGILATDDPKQVKSIGRTVRDYDEAAWAVARFDLVTRGNIAKFGQDAALRAFLLGTGEDVLVEASPVDAVWGIGLARDHKDALDPHRWQGLNLLGFALMRARAVLRGLTP